MSCSLIEKLGEIEDFRTTDGRRHPLWVVLIIVLMGTMSGYLGYRALGDFAKRHREDLVEALKIPKGRVPSYSTIRRVMMGIDFDELAKVFQSWASESVNISAGEWLSIDGKSIRGTVHKSHSPYQNFICVVSVFTNHQGLVLTQDKFENKHGSEISTVQGLIKTLHLEQAVLSMDSLHCQKKLVS